MTNTIRQANPGKTMARTAAVYLIFRRRLFHNRQVAITYEHADAWNGPVPAYKGDRLPNTVKKLEEGQTLTIVLSGDSIAEGGNSSQVIGALPLVPDWFTMFTDSLKRVYSAELVTHNTAVGGQISTWGMQNAHELVGPVCAGSGDTGVWYERQSDSGRVRLYDAGYHGKDPGGCPRL